MHMRLNNKIFILSIIKAELVKLLAIQTLLYSNVHTIKRHKKLEKDSE